MAYYLKYFWGQDIITKNYNSMKTILAFCFSLLSTFAFSQDKLTPASWSFQVVDSGEDYIFQATVNLDDGWAIYSQYTAEGGPVPLTFSYKDKSILNGETEEKSEAIKKMSDLFDLEVIKFKNKAVFEQGFTKKNGLKSFSGELQYMCCDDSRCLPPTVVQFDIGL